MRETRVSRRLYSMKTVGAGPRNALATPLFLVLLVLPQVYFTQALLNLAIYKVYGFLSLHSCEAKLRWLLRTFV